MSAAKPGASAKQAKQAKGTEEEARPEVYNAIKQLLDSLVSSDVPFVPHIANDNTNRTGSHADHQAVPVQGVDEHEPRIVDMIMDFVFSYTTDVLQDAHAFSESAGNEQGTVGQQDVELAIHSRVDMSLAQSPNLEVWCYVLYCGLHISAQATTPLLISSIGGTHLGCCLLQGTGCRIS